MKAFNKQWLAVAGLALSGASAFASHVPNPGISFGSVFTVTPSAAVAGEAFAPFQADLINFRYGSRVDQAPGTPGDSFGVGATGTFTEAGAIQYGPFFKNMGTTPIGAGTSGLNHGPGTTGYLLYALFQGTGNSTTTNADPNPPTGPFADLLRKRFKQS